MISLIFTKILNFGGDILHWEMNFNLTCLLLIKGGGLFFTVVPNHLLSALVDIFFFQIFSCFAIPLIKVVVPIFFLAEIKKIGSPLSEDLVRKFFLYQAL